MTTQILRRAIQAPRDVANRASVESLRLAVMELSGSLGNEMQRAVRVCELVDAGLLQFTTSKELGRVYEQPTLRKALDAKLNLVGGGTLSGGSLVLDYTGDSTSTLSVISPGSSAAGSEVSISSPAGNPGVIGIFNAVNRSDIHFSADGIELAASTTTGGVTPQFRFDSAGRFSGIALHNNASGAAGTTRQYVASGTYTPTITNGANVDSSSAQVCSWMRVGNVVAVSGRVDVDPTVAASTLTAIGVSLPIASALAGSGQLGGGGVVGTNPFIPLGVVADLANDRATLNFYSTTTGSVGIIFNLLYLVV